MDDGTMRISSRGDRGFLALLQRLHTRLPDSSRPLCLAGGAGPGGRLGDTGAVGKDSRGVCAFACEQPRLRSPDFQTMSRGMSQPRQI